MPAQAVMRSQLALAFESPAHAQDPDMCAAHEESMDAGNIVTKSLLAVHHPAAEAFMAAKLRANGAEEMRAVSSPRKRL